MSQVGQTAGDVAVPLSWYVRAFSWTPAYARASLILRVAGGIEHLYSSSGGSVNPGSPFWYYGGTPPTRWVRMTVVSGTMTGGPSAGTWHALSSERTWYKELTSSGLQVVEFDLEIASDALGTTIVSTFRGMTLEAEVIV